MYASLKMIAIVKNTRTEKEFLRRSDMIKGKKRNGREGRNKSDAEEGRKEERHLRMYLSMKRKLREI